MRKVIIRLNLVLFLFLTISTISLGIIAFHSAYDTYQSFKNGKEIELLEKESEIKHHLKLSLPKEFNTQFNGKNYWFDHELILKAIENGHILDSSREYLMSFNDEYYTVTSYRVKDALSEGMKLETSLSLQDKLSSISLDRDIEHLRIRDQILIGIALFFSFLFYIFFSSLICFVATGKFSFYITETSFLELLRKKEILFWSGVFLFLILLIWGSVINHF